MGYHPRADGHDIISTSPLVEQWLDRLLQIRKDTQAHMTRAQHLWVKHRDTPKYKEGDKVWLEGRNLQVDPIIISQLVSWPSDVMAPSQLFR